MRQPSSEPQEPSPPVTPRATGPGSPDSARPVTPIPELQEYATLEGATPELAPYLAEKAEPEALPNIEPTLQDPEAALDALVELVHDGTNSVGSHTALARNQEPADGAESHDSFIGAGPAIEPELASGSGTGFTPPPNPPSASGPADDPDEPGDGEPSDDVGVEPLRVASSPEGSSLPEADPRPDGRPELPTALDYALGEETLAFLRAATTPENERDTDGLRVAGQAWLDIATAAETLLDNAALSADVPAAQDLYQRRERLVAHRQTVRAVLDALDNADTADTSDLETALDAATSALPQLIAAPSDEVSLEAAPLPTAAPPDPESAPSAPDNPALLDPMAVPHDPDEPLLGPDRYPIHTTVMYTDLVPDPSDPAGPSRVEDSRIELAKYETEPAAARALQRQLSERLATVHTKQLLARGLRPADAGVTGAYPDLETGELVVEVTSGVGAEAVPVEPDEEMANAYARIEPEIRALHSRAKAIALGDADPALVIALQNDVLAQAQSSNQMMSEQLAQELAPQFGAVEQDLNIAAALINDARDGKLSPQELRAAGPMLQLRYDLHVAHLQNRLDAVIAYQPERDEPFPHFREQILQTAEQLRKDAELFVPKRGKPEPNPGVHTGRGGEEPHSASKALLAAQLITYSLKLDNNPLLSPDEIADVSRELGKLYEPPDFLNGLTADERRDALEPVRPGELDPAVRAGCPPRITQPYQPGEQAPSVPINLVVIDSDSEESLYHRQQRGGFGGATGSMFRADRDSDDEDNEAIVAELYSGEVNLDSSPVRIVSQIRSEIQNYQQRLHELGYRRSVRQQISNASGNVPSDPPAKRAADIFSGTLGAAAQRALDRVDELPDTESGARAAMRELLTLQKTAQHEGIRSDAANAVLTLTAREFRDAYKPFEKRGESSSPQRAAEASVKADALLTTMKAYLQTLDERMREHLGSQQAPLCLSEKDRLERSVGALLQPLDEIRRTLSPGLDSVSEEFAPTLEQIFAVHEHLTDVQYVDDDPRGEIHPAVLREFAHLVTAARHRFPPSVLGPNCSVEAISRHFLGDDPDDGHPAPRTPISPTSSPAGYRPTGSPATPPTGPGRPLRRS